MLLRMLASNATLEKNLKLKKIMGCMWMMSLWYGFAIKMANCILSNFFEESLHHDIIQMYNFFFEVWYVTCN